MPLSNLNQLIPANWWPPTNNYYQDVLFVNKSNGRNSCNCDDYLFISKRFYFSFFFLFAIFFDLPFRPFLRRSHVNFAQKWSLWLLDEMHFCCIKTKSFRETMVSLADLILSRIFCCTIWMAQCCLFRQMMMMIHQKFVRYRCASLLKGTKKRERERERHGRARGGEKEKAIRKNEIK